MTYLEPDLSEFVAECGWCGRPLREDETCDCGDELVEQSDIEGTRDVDASGSRGQNPKEELS